MERFRVGLIGCGVISDIYLKTCQKFDILDVVAARQDGIKPPPAWLDFPGVEAGARGVQFVDAAVKSNESGGTWVEIAPSIDA